MHSLALLEEDDTNTKLDDHVVGEKEDQNLFIYLLYL